MNKIQIGILALAGGACIGTTLRPGFPEIVIVTVVALAVSHFCRTRPSRPAVANGEPA